MNVVGGLAIQDGRCLMGKRPSGKMRPEMWEYPGGKIDPGEDGRTALVREWREELNIDITIGMMIGQVSLDVEVPLVWTLYVVRCVDPSPMTNRAHSALAWIDPLEAVKSLPCTPTTYLIYPHVRDFLAGRNR